MLQTVLLIVQIVIAISVVVFILLQSKGAGVGTAFGGEAVVYRSRRGVEKVLHYATIVASVILVVLSLVLVLLKNNQ